MLLHEHRTGSCELVKPVRHRRKLPVQPFTTQAYLPSIFRLMSWQCNATGNWTHIIIHAAARESNAGSGARLNRTS